MAAHENELQILADRLDNQKKQKQLQMREKLSEKRKQKMEALRRKQEAEITREMLMQKKEMDEIKAKKVESM